jgi:hypothetical protein
MCSPVGIETDRISEILDSANDVLEEMGMRTGDFVLTRHCQRLAQAVELLGGTAVD